MTSDVSLIKGLHENGQDWNVSIPAQAAGIAALDEENYLLASKELIRVERQYLTAQLEGLGAKTFGSEANYIFFKLEKPENLAELLSLSGEITASYSVSQQSQTVKGVVVDKSTGEPIIGANVVVKGTTNGVITDFDGNYTLDAPVGSILVISYIGYQSIEVKAVVNGRMIETLADQFAKLALRILSFVSGHPVHARYFGPNNQSQCITAGIKVV